VYESNSDSDDANRCASRKIDPFAPDAAVPLPFQIGEEYGFDKAPACGCTVSSRYLGPNTVWKRNERERHRVRCVNDGYEALRAALPVLQHPLVVDRTVPRLCCSYSERRLSKVETLRVAIGYINHLEVWVMHTYRSSRIAQALLSDDAHTFSCTCFAYMNQMLSSGATTLRCTDSAHRDYRLVDDTVDVVDTNNDSTTNCAQPRAARGKKRKVSE
jgi:hypothetical protein